MVRHLANCGFEPRLSSKATGVGAYGSSRSFYGTFDQAGNAVEMTEGLDLGLICRKEVVVFPTPPRLGPPQPSGAYFPPQQNISSAAFG